MYMLHRWDTYRWQRLPDGFLQAGVGSLLRSIHQREPGSPVIAMGNQADRLVILPKHQQHNHLAIALGGAVVGARAISRIVAGFLQVKRAHDLQADPANLAD
jgi:hypothetical protein